MYKRIPAALTVAVVAVLAFTAAAPAQATHQIDYSINNHDVFESRATSFGTTDVAWRVVAGVQDMCFAKHTTLPSDSVQKRYHYYLTTHAGTIVADSPIYYMNYGESAQWAPGTPGYSLSSYHMQIKVVVSTNGGGYIDTITMQPEQQLAGKNHSEWPAYYFNWPC